MGKLTIYTENTLNPDLLPVYKKIKTTVKYKSISNLLRNHRFIIMVKDYLLGTAFLSEYIYIDIYHQLYKRASIEVDNCSSAETWTL